MRNSVPGDILARVSASSSLTRNRARKLSFRLPKCLLLRHLELQRKSSFLRGLFWFGLSVTRPLFIQPTCHLHSLTYEERADVQIQSRGKAIPKEEWNKGGGWEGGLTRIRTDAISHELKRCQDVMAASVSLYLFPLPNEFSVVVFLLSQLFLSSSTRYVNPFIKKESHLKEITMGTGESRLKNGSWCFWSSKLGIV